MAYTLTKADVIGDNATGGIAAELAGTVLSDLEWATVIAQAQEQVQTDAWGSAARAKMGAVWLAAHQATLVAQGKKAIDGLNSPGGPLASVAVGQVSQSFAVPTEGLSPSALSLSSTRYGREYLRLARIFCSRMVVL
jgi:hypothetical protein